MTRIERPIPSLFLGIGIAFLLHGVLSSEVCCQDVSPGSDFTANTIGPETLLPLEQRGLIRLNWKPYQRRSRFEFKRVERPIYRILIAPDGTPASKGRVHVTYDTSYPFTNLERDKAYNIQVEVEQNGQVVLPEQAIKAEPILPKVKWYAAPRAEGGRANNPGTYDKPVDVPFVCAQAGPGDVVVLKSGTYHSPAQNQNQNKHDRSLHPAKSGSPGAHILFLAESNDVSKAKYVSFRTAWGNISVNKTDYVVFDGINCDSDQGLNAKALTSILGEYGHRPMGVIVRNIYYRAYTSDKQIMVNTSREVLIENCFFPGSAESHNAYLCNNTRNRPAYSDSRIIFRNCISMNSTRNNVHANGFFDNFIIENNIFVAAKVANISLATVHRNSHIRNNIAYSGAKQAVTLNFYQEKPGVPLEDREPSANIHICHNTFVVPDTVEYGYADILISDTRHLPNRQTIRGLYIKNNILVNLKKSGETNAINLWQSRHLAQMEVSGNVYFLATDHGEVHLPARSSNEKSLFPFTLLESHSKEGKPFSCLDAYRDGEGQNHLEPYKTRLGLWSRNKGAKDLAALFHDFDRRDFRPAEGSPAVGGGVADADTRRIIRDIYGNPRNQEEGKVDAGAVAAGSDPFDRARPSEFVLLRGDPLPEMNLKPGKSTLVAHARLQVRTPKRLSLNKLMMEFILQKKDKNQLLNIKQGLVAEVEIKGDREKIIRKNITFQRDDQAGYDTVWITGTATGLKVSAADGEELEVKVYATLKDVGKLNYLTAVIAHDNIWGFDARGWKVAVTGHNELHFKLSEN